MNVWQKFKGWIAKKMNFTVETSPAMKEESFLEWLGVKRKNKDVMAEVTYFTCLKMLSEPLCVQTAIFYALFFSSSLANTLS